MFTIVIAIPWYISKIIWFSHSASSKNILFLMLDDNLMVSLFVSQMAAVRCTGRSLCRLPPCIRVGSRLTVALHTASHPTATPSPAIQKLL